jgi:hypothetical protein
MTPSLTFSELLKRWRKTADAIDDGDGCSIVGIAAQNLRNRACELQPLVDRLEALASDMETHLIGDDIWTRRLRAILSPRGVI